MEDSKKLNWEQSQEVDAQIDKKMAGFVSKFNEQLKWMESNRQKIENTIPMIREELKETVNQLFNNKEFMGEMYKHLHRYIEQEIESKIKEKELHQMARDLILQKVEDEFKGLVQEVINRVFKQMNRDFESRLDVTRKLVYSLESDIRHTMQRLPITETEEQIVRDAIARMQAQTQLRIDGPSEAQ